MDLDARPEARAIRREVHQAVAELSGRTVLIVGLGQIGAEVARLAAAFGMRVVGLNRTGSGDHPYVEELDRLGAHDVMIGVVAGNDAAQRFYERRGMTPAIVTLLRVGPKPAGES